MGETPVWRIRCARTSRCNFPIRYSLFTLRSRFILTIHFPKFDFSKKGFRNLTEAFHV